VAQFLRLKEKQTMTMKICYFTIEGKAMTWLLRHLWAEGSELKAVKMWTDTFPQCSSIDDINTHFIDIVSGKKKFVGTNEFDIVDDNRKCWDPNKSGKDNKHFPLLDSWHDVMLLKKVRLYISEFHLRSFRLIRKYPSTFKENKFYTLNWLSAVEENKIENSIRVKINEYWADIRNISRQFFLDPTLEYLPTDFLELSEGPTFKNKKNYKSQFHNYGVYTEVFSYLNPIRDYFNKKYEHLFVFSDNEIVHESYESKQPEFTTLLGNENDSFVNARTNQSDAIIARAMANIGPAINVEQYVNALLKESDRKNIEPEDIRKTEWRSGYIDRDGNFYGCSDLNHINFSEELCEKFNFKHEGKDAQILLDKKGFVKVSMNRFFWDYDKITEHQKITIHDYMRSKNMFKTHFNSTIEEKTFDEVFKQ
jgi:hypothetical protein